MKKFGLTLLVLLIFGAIGAVFYFTGTDGVSIPGSKPAPEAVALPPAPENGTPPPPNDTAMVRPPATTSASREAWEDTISEALSDSSISNEQAVQRLLSLSYDDKVDEEIRIEALEHSLNLTDDGNFYQIVPLFVDKNTPGEMLETILTDLYNRGDKVKLESILEVVKIPDHPTRNDAMELLTFYIDEEDYGTNWDQWKSAIEKYLSENGSE